MSPDYRLDPPDYSDNEEADSDCFDCKGFGRVEDEDEDGKRLVDCECVVRNREKAAWARRLNAVKAKHERTGGPDEQQLADWGRSS